MKDLAAGERLGRKFTFSPFLPHGRGFTVTTGQTHAKIHRWKDGQTDAKMTDFMTD